MGVVWEWGSLLQFASLFFSLQKMTQPQIGPGLQGEPSPHMGNGWVGPYNNPVYVQLRMGLNLFFSFFGKPTKTNFPLKLVYIYIYMCNIQVTQDQALHLPPEEINDHQTAKLAI